MAQSRRPIFFNNKTSSIQIDTDLSNVQRFHRQLPNYAHTPLISLDDVAKNLGVKNVFVKDESNRLGLPAFKILGASWGSCRAIIARTGIPTDSPLEEIAQSAQREGIVLFTASAGNHGRALAAMARTLGVQAHIYVPHTVNDEAIRLISAEGGKVTRSTKDYDGAIFEAWDAASRSKGGLFVQDSAFKGYDDIPKWIVEGYSTLLFETEEQLGEQNLRANLIVTPVGVGSLAHAVVRHSACLYQSLMAGKPTSVTTRKTSMEGMNCGTLSSTAFQDLQQGIDFSATISDYESHQAIQYLSKYSVNTGPCGGAALAALWRLADNRVRPEWLREDSVVVILNTEGLREYEIPLDVSSDDPVELTQILTKINSSNPDLSEAAGAGETAIASYIDAWLEHRGMESNWIEAQPGRPSVVGVLRGSGSGKSLMINGHIDTVSLSTHTSGDPLSGELRDGRIHGRGCLDMKAGVAAGMAAMARMANSSSRQSGDVILAAVSDEENLSRGTEAVLAAGWKADAALVTEPTAKDIVTSHKGFVWFEIDVLGAAAHGSLPEEGVDAILLAGYLQTALLDYARTMPSDPRLGQASLHSGRIVGGEEPSSYPAICTLTIEFRTVSTQSPKSLTADLNELLKSIANKIPQFRYNSPRITFSRPPSELADENTFVQTFIASVSKTLNDAPAPAGKSFWCDAGLLNEAGIPSIVYGPKGEGLHAKNEWVDTQSIYDVTNVLETTIREFCQ
ncbi:hypothetical protein B5807_04704 [Epicoccum nigrum]|uniref:Succinyl-diaminopimelate desuccinylase n=1 Tax=Epicoccum nigrum TaxID=105696 RepID=A0A1Y2M272_EPING|nr:hypothetical protein B5807_04704 [Epicoccum nigrum]